MFVDYLWQRGQEKDIPKLSYAKKFDEWNLTVGTGVYIDDIDKLYGQTRLFVLIIFSIIALIALAMLFFIFKSVVGRISDVTNIVRDMAQGEGDLTARMVVQGQDEFHDFSEHFNQFVEKIELLVKSIKTSAEQVLTSSEEVSSGNNQLSSSTQEMASSLEETAASVEEISASIQDTANASVETAAKIKKTATEAENGSHMLTEMTTAMKDVKSSGDKIQEIVSVVNDIAFQTNLLALNAAVEAARAGEEGKGFAVVASEVRSLAARSADAATEIKDLVENNESNIKKANDMSYKTVEMLQKIITRIQEASFAIQDIETRSKEQASSIRQISDAVMQMDEVTQRNAALVEELASSAQDMSHISKMLSNEIGRFKVSDEGSGFSKTPKKPSSYSAPTPKPTTKLDAKPATKPAPKPAAKSAPLPKSQPAAFAPVSGAAKKEEPKKSSKNEEVFFDDDKFEEF